jgi:clan AA aspartic protease
MSRRQEKTLQGYFDEYRQPRVRITVAGTHDEIAVDAVIDTGFDGDLCLPTQIAIELGLELRDVMSVELADGTIKQELLFAGVVRLGRQRRTVNILLTESDDALLGVNLLSYLELDFVNRTVRLR